MSAYEGMYIHPEPVKRGYDWRKGAKPRTRAALDRFFESAPIRAVKRDICQMGRRLWERGYVDGNGGNISVRVGEELVLCTPTLCSKGFMEERDICLCDMEAGQLCGYRPRTSEVKVHIAMMKASGMDACIHCHPPHCNAFLFAGATPPNGINPEADIFFGQIALAPYGTPGGDAVAASVAEAARKSNVVFMENHGIVTGGRSVEEAEWFAENADAYCKTLLLADAHGLKLNQVGPKAVKDFLAIRRSLGLPVDESAPLYNTNRFNGYRLGIASE